MDQIHEQHSGARVRSGLVAMALARLPRIAGVTLLAMGAAFVGVHLLPGQYKASRDLPLTAGDDAGTEIDHILSPQQLADSVARLPDATVLELRRQGGGLLDSTALLRRQLVLSPAADGAHLRLEVVAASADHARAMVDAVAASYRPAEQDLPAPLPAPAEAEATEPPVQPVARIGATDTGLLQQRLTLAWENRIRLEEKAARIDTLIAAGNFSALALQAEGLPALGRRLDALATLEAEREKLAVTLLPNHPTMRTLSEQITLASGEIAQQAGELAALARADSEAASRLETGLRAEYDAQLASAAVDTTVLTGAIGTAADPVTEVTALPRPIGPAWALALSGSLAFFGQIGLIALQRPRPGQPDEELFAAPQTGFAPPLEESGVFQRQVHAPEPAYRPAPTPAAPQPPAPPPVAPGWFADPGIPPATAVAAHWMGNEPAAPVLPAAPPPSPGTEARRAPADPLAGLDAARIVAIRSTGSQSDSRAWARELLDAYAADGRRVVLIDAASRRRGAAPGISDLSMGRATFADIVHGTGRNEAALIPWGRQDTLYAAARPVRTLLLALVELYDVVVITLDADAGGSSHLADMADFVLAATPRSDGARRARRA